MSKILVVFGATGNQGGSAINCILNDPELSKEWKIRGVTRDTSKPAAQDLKQKGVEVVAADFDDTAALKRAVEGADTVYIVTSSLFGENAYSKELAHGKTVADAAVAAGAKYIILSGMTDVAKLTNGKLSKVQHFDVKAHQEDYIRSLPIKSAYIYPGSFMENLSSVMAPRKAEDGTFVFATNCNPDTKLPLVDIPDDNGKWVAAILANPDKYNGKVLRAATKEYTFQEIVDIISKKTGKTVTYKQLPDDVFKSFFPAGVADQYLQMFQLFRDYNYYGPDQSAMVKWTAEQARGKLTTLEEYLDKNPLKLE